MQWNNKKKQGALNDNKVRQQILRDLYTTSTFIYNAHVLIQNGLTSKMRYTALPLNNSDKVHHTHIVLTPRVSAGVIIHNPRAAVH